MYTINYSFSKDFYAGIAALVRDGIGFKADFDTLTITLTGAY